MSLLSLVYFWATEAERVLTLAESAAFYLTVRSLFSLRAFAFSSFWLIVCLSYSVRPLTFSSYLFWQEETKSLCLKALIYFCLMTSEWFWAAAPSLSKSLALSRLVSYLSVSSKVFLGLGTFAMVYAFSDRMTRSLVLLIFALSSFKFSSALVLPGFYLLKRSCKSGLVVVVSTYTGIYQYSLSFLPTFYYRIWKFSVFIVVIDLLFV